MSYYEEDIDKNCHEFDQIDPVLNRFASDFGLDLFRVFKDFPLRAFQIEGKIIQITVSTNGSIRVSVSMDRYPCTLETLYETLVKVKEQFLYGKKKEIVRSP